MGSSFPADTGPLSKDCSASRSGRLLAHVGGDDQGRGRAAGADVDPTRWLSAVWCGRPVTARRSEGRGTRCPSECACATYSTAIAAHIARCWAANRCRHPGTPPIVPRTRRRCARDGRAGPVAVPPAHVPRCRVGSGRPPLQPPRERPTPAATAARHPRLPHHPEQHDLVHGQKPHGPRGQAVHGAHRDGPGELGGDRSPAGDAWVRPRASPSSPPSVIVGGRRSWSVVVRRRSSRSAVMVGRRRSGRHSSPSVNHRSSPRRPSVGRWSPVVVCRPPGRSSSVAASSVVRRSVGHNRGSCLAVDVRGKSSVGRSAVVRRRRSVVGRTVGAGWEPTSLPLRNSGAAPPALGNGESRPAIHERPPRAAPERRSNGNAATSSGDRAA